MVIKGKKILYTKINWYVGGKYKYLYIKIANSILLDNLSKYKYLPNYNNYSDI